MAELDAFKGREMPKWIRDNPAFEGKKKVNKVFPSFGLKNFREKVEVVGSVNPAARAANASTTDMIDALWDGLKAIEIAIRKTILKPIANKSVGNDEIKSLHDKYGRFQNKHSSISYLLREFQDAIRPQTAIVGQEDGRVKILLQQAVSDENGKTIGRVNEPAFRVYEKIKKLIETFGKEFGMTVVVSNLDSILSVKEFHRSNIPLAKNSMEIVFSAENEGAWDLATMSMRGIESCQSWGGDDENCLIGSILSKYAGIIYLTSGKDFEGRGESMAKRCIVRFGVNMKTKTPVIIMDRMYDSYEPRIAKLFVDALQKRTPLKVLNYASNFSEEPISMSDMQSTPNREDIGLPGEPKYDYDKKWGPSYKDTSFRTLEKKDKEPLSEKEQNDEVVNTVVSIAMSIANQVKLVGMEANRKRNAIMYATVQPVYLNLTKFIRKHKIINVDLMKKVLLKELIKQSNNINENKERYVEFCVEHDISVEDEYETAIADYWKQIVAISKKILNQQ